MDDALSELELFDDETVRLRFGECFFTMPVDNAKEKVEHIQHRLKKEIASADQDLGK